MNISSSGRRVRILVAVGVVALVASVIAVSPTSADQQVSSQVETAATDSDHDGVLDASAADEAAAAAIRSGEPVEDLSRRTESATIVANPDGTWTSKDFGEPVRIRRNDKWVDVDYTLTKQGDGSWAPKAAPVDVTVDGGSSKEAAQVTFEDGSSLAVTWPDDLPTPTIEGGVATYEVSAAIDLIVAVTGSGVATRIRLNEAPTEDDPVFPLGLTTEGLKLDQNAAGGVTAKDASGKTVGSTSTLIAWDGRTDHAGEPAEIVPVEATLDQTSSKGTGDETMRTHDLELEGPSKILDDPSTEYPVIIDPDINAVTQWRDTWVRSGTTANQGNSYRLLVGSLAGDSNANQTRSLIQWHDTQYAGKAILAATMGVYQYDAGSCSPRDMYVLPLAAGFTEGSTVWTNAPGYISSSGDNVTVTANRSRTGCAVGNGYTTANITKMVSSWASGRYANHGLMLTAPAAAGTDTTYERRFCSWEPDTSQTQTPCTVATRMPYLSVTYNSYPSTATAPTATIDGAQVSVRATISDPDGGDVRARFVVKNGSTTVFDGMSDYVASGQPAIKELPDLTNGTYTVQAWANDGSLSSKTASTVGTFTVAAGAPGPFTPVTSTQAGTFTLSGGSEKTVQITGLAGIPSATTAGRALLTMRATGWSSAGGVSVYDISGEAPDTSDLDFSASMSPSTGTSTTSIFDLSSDGAVTVLNHGDDPVTVQLSVQGWFPLGAARPQLREVPPDEGPAGESDGRLTPVARIVSQAQVPGAVAFPIPLETGQTISMIAGVPTVKSSNGTVQGTFELVIFDDAGVEVPGTLGVSGNSVVVSIAGAPSATWPLSALPIFNDGSQE